MRAALAWGTDALERLEPGWWKLWHRSPRATPFQSPAWLIPWARAFAGPAAGALTLGEEGRLQALLPLLALDDHHGRRLMLLGAGTTDHLDGLFAPELETALLPRLLGPLRDEPALGSGLELTRLAADSPLMRDPNGWQASGRAEEEPAPVLDLAGAVPRSMAQNLRTARNRAERVGRLTVERAAADALDDLFRLHRARWSQRDEAGVLADPLVQRFHRMAAPALDSASMLRLYALHLDGQLIAVHYGLCAKGRAYYYIGGFDPTFASVSPGTLAVGHAIEDARREGFAEFDFLRGREGYKYRWGALDRPAYRRVLAPLAL